MNKKAAGKYLLVFVGVFFLSYFFGYMASSNQAARTQESKVVSESIADQPLNDFSLDDHNGNVVSLEKFIGQWSFVFFGYTNCPDVCPATLSQLVMVNKKLKQKPSVSKMAQFFFVSVDPSRDSKQHLKRYVQYFDTDFIGLTGNLETIKKFENQFGAFHLYGEKTSDDFYNVAHTASVFLVNPHGVIVTKFSPPMDVTSVVEQFSVLVEQFAKAYT
jgi:protein SCO1/2